MAACFGRMIYCAARMACATILCRRAQAMKETPSIRMDTETTKRLGALAKRSRRSNSFPAPDAVAAYVESEEWQLAQIQAGIAELDSGRGVSHEKVANWLKNWGKPGEIRPPK